MGLYNDIIAQIQSYADATGEDSIKVSIGSEGDYVEINELSEETGQAWETPGWLDCVIKGIGVAIEALLGSPQEEVLTTTIGQTSYTLTYTPKIAAKMKCGYNLTVYRNGSRMTYASSPSNSSQYGFTAGTKTVSFTVSSGGETLVFHYQA